MNFRAISAWKPAGLPKLHNSDESTHAQAFRSALSRRNFARAVAGTAAIGAAFGSEEEEEEEERSRKNRWTFAPIPIPKGSPGIDTGHYHVFGPGPAGGLDPIDAEPATITNFNGFVGLTYLSGTVTQTNTETGDENVYPFVDSDMRFMTGRFRGTDGKEHQAAFALV
jgi:hypothetical protein